MRWSKAELLTAAAQYRRDLSERVGTHYAELSDAEVQRFVAWLADGDDDDASGRTPTLALAAAVELPQKLAELVQDWVARGRPAQSASSWDRLAWEAMLPKHIAILRRLPDDLDRAAVRVVAAHAAETDRQALEAYLAAMVWGYGKVGFGPYRSRRVLDHSIGAARQLRDAARAVAVSATAGYDQMAGPGRLPYLGPAFGTKFLCFTQPPDAAERALILDAFVAEGLERFANVRLNPVPWSSQTYRRYLTLMHGWAAVLGVSAEELEYVIFQRIADDRGGQWAGPG